MASNADFKVAYGAGPVVPAVAVNDICAKLWVKTSNDAING